MKGAQDVRKERANKRAIEQLKRDENVKIIEELVLDRFRELETTSVTVWECEGFFVIEDDDTDIPFSNDSMSALFKDFNNEEGYNVEYVNIVSGKIGLEISIID